MLDKEIIHESRSQWHSPLVIVPKREGALCLCIDLLNTVAKFDVFPMPSEGNPNTKQKGGSGSGM